MIWPDLVNGVFEMLGGLFIAASIVRILRDKRVAGINWIHPAFFTAWGLWNLYYYPHLGQIISFLGGMGVVTANTVWVYLLIYYTYRRKK